jgi:dTMP kinase
MIGSMNSPVRRSGFFITLEGGEGAGKSTLTRGLSSALRAAGVPLKITREPGGTKGATAIRELLVSREDLEWRLLPETLLFYASRAENLEKVILPHLLGGFWVICDRFYDSTYAYQFHKRRGMKVAQFKELNRIIGTPTPDLTLILDVDPEVGLRRSQGHLLFEDRYEHMDAAFHKRVRDGFLTIAKREPERCVVIDASKSKSQVLKAALKAIRDRLQRPKNVVPNVTNEIRKVATRD